MYLGVEVHALGHRGHGGRAASLAARRAGGKFRPTPHFVQPRALVPERAFRSSVAARASAGSSSEEPAIAFDPRVDTYTERRRAWEKQLNARRKEWAAEFKAREDAKAAAAQSERARIEEAKAARKAAKVLKSAARAEEVAREEKARARAKETALRRKAVVRAPVSYTHLTLPTILLV